MIVHSLSESAKEGLKLLKGGAVAIKHGRSGKPHPTTFTLSADESSISWAAPRSLGKMAARRLSGSSGPRREICVADVVELLVGRESNVFSRRANDVGNEHLSLSLVLRGALPAPPSADDAAEPVSTGRETLDVSFSCEEHFGLWVAAMTSL